MRNTTLSTQNQTRSPDDIDFWASLVSRVFSALKAIFPAWKQAFETQDDYENAKRVWLSALRKARITEEELKRGLAKASRSTNPFLPSVGMFIEWCKDEDYHELGLPTESEMLERYKSFLGFAKYEEHEFKYRSKAEYYLLKEFYSSMRMKSDDDVKKAIPNALKDVAQKVRDGFDFPEIPKLIEQKTLSCDYDRLAKRVAQTRAELGF